MGGIMIYRCHNASLGYSWLDAAHSSPLLLAICKLKTIRYATLNSWSEVLDPFNSMANLPLTSVGPIFDTWNLQSML